MNPQTEYWKKQAELAKILIESAFPGNSFPVNEMNNWLKSVNQPVPQDNHEWPTELLEELWDQYSWSCGEDIDELGQVAGKSVMLRSDFMKIGKCIQTKFDHPITDTDGKPVELDERWIPWDGKHPIPEDQDFDVKFANGNVYKFYADDWDIEEFPITHYRLLQNKR